MTRKFAPRTMINSIITSVLFATIPSTPAGKPVPIDPTAFQLKAVDDASHEFSSAECFEWWYLDASFDNGYSW